MVPDGTCPGDRICVVKGCSSLVVLRKKDDYYIHVGPCYFLGLSNGEMGRLIDSRSDGVKTNDWTSTKVERFEIR